jgi:hypothetical protein
VADDQHGAVIIGDHFLQQVERFEIEIVGRLVEHQQVRFAAQIRAPAAGGTARRPKACRPAPRPAWGRTGSPSDSPGCACAPRARRSSRHPRPARRARAFRATSGCAAGRSRCRRASWRRVMVPSSGASSPVSSFSSVVLPVPLAPTIPIRSPRWMRRVKSLMIVRSPKRLVTLSATITLLVFTSSLTTASLAVPCGPSMAARAARISYSFSRRP